MDYKKHAILLEIVRQLNAHKSWTGKTHLQKACFLLQTAYPTIAPFDFVLYKHGPFSFDLEAELAQMKSYDALRSQPVGGYGVQLNPGSNETLVRQKADLSTDEQNAITAVCSFVGNRDVKELERLATAAWIMQQEHVTESLSVANRLHELKPHIPLTEAIDANKQVAQFLNVVST